jgi:hypothetical protein
MSIITQYFPQWALEQPLPRFVPTFPVHTWFCPDHGHHNDKRLGWYQWQVADLAFGFA